MPTGLKKETVRLVVFLDGLEKQFVQRREIVGAHEFRGGCEFSRPPVYAAMLAQLSARPGSSEWPRPTERDEKEKRDEFRFGCWVSRSIPVWFCGSPRRLIF